MKVFPACLLISIHDLSMCIEESTVPLKYIFPYSLLRPFLCFTTNQFAQKFQFWPTSSYILSLLVIYMGIINH